MTQHSAEYMAGIAKRLTDLAIKHNTSLEFNSTILDQDLASSMEVSFTLNRLNSSVNVYFGEIEGFCRYQVSFHSKHTTEAEIEGCVLAIESVLSRGTFKLNDLIGLGRFIR
jgi:hypothetical protein